MSLSLLRQTINLLIPFLWPKNNKSIKRRVILAVLCLLVAKVASLGTPPILGYAVDTLTDISNGINMYIFSCCYWKISRNLQYFTNYTSRGVIRTRVSIVNTTTSITISITVPTVKKRIRYTYPTGCCYCISVVIYKRISN